MSKIATVPSQFISTNDTIFYNIVENFIPPEWRNLTSSSGKVLSKTSIQILSLLVSRTPSDENKAKEVEKNGTSASNELQETYYFFAKMLGLCQRRIRQCLVELEKSGYIQVALINVIEQYTKYRNILSIRLTKNFVPYPQKISDQTEKVFGCTRNNFPPHNIIDNNKSRYEESNFKNENLEAENKNTSDSSHDLELDLPQDSTSIATAESNETTNNSDSGLVSQVVNTAKTWWGMKKAEEFHPLTEEDAE
ncbi:MAG: hypothetical protein ACRCRR_02895 [Rickettsia sp.]